MPEVKGEIIEIAEKCKHKDTELGSSYCEVQSTEQGY
jgi:hypothetical protein